MMTAEWVLLAMEMAGVPFFLIRLWWVYRRPLRRLNEALRGYLETKDLRYLEKYDFRCGEDVNTFLKYLVREHQSGTMSELKRQHAEYLALQNQINPHFLFNTLEDIRSDALEAGMDELAMITGAFAMYFRYTITEPSDLVLFEDELDNVENYYRIQRYRFGDRIRMEIEFPNEHLGYPKVRLPKLTLQPLVENAISHGLEGKAGQGILRILVETTQNDLLVHVRDNGVGMAQEEVDELNQRLAESREQAMSGQNELIDRHNGIALQNINHRIRLLFGENYGLHVFSVLGEGTDVQVRIPLLEERMATQSGENVINGYEKTHQEEKQLDHE